MQKPGRAQVWEAALRIPHLDIATAATFLADADAAPLHDISKSVTAVHSLQRIAFTGVRRVRQTMVGKQAS
ncbi:MAG: hypothetical protein FRX49_11335 [Trebouxia sp. A1-2]|nr:MAG: hypothetical protein FRX49_11335 [Trebouxia sp. A1-2]